MGKKRNRITERQIRLLEKLGEQPHECLDWSKSEAQHEIRWLLSNMKRIDATSPAQQKYLVQLGVDPERASTMTKSEAQAEIERRKTLCSPAQKAYLRGIGVPATVADAMTRKDAEIIFRNHQRR